MMSSQYALRNNSVEQQKEAMNRSSYMSSQPDIPLREPLDFEFRLNRKMAKKIY